MYSPYFSRHVCGQLDSGGPACVCVCVCVCARACVHSGGDQCTIYASVSCFGGKHTHTHTHHPTAVNVLFEAAVDAVRAGAKVFVCDVPRVVEVFLYIVHEKSAKRKDNSSKRTRSGQQIDTERHPLPKHPLCGRMSQEP